MRKVVLYHLRSADGVAEEPGDWMTDGGDIGVHGSTTLARSLLHAGLVDELRLVVAPALAGHGRRLFDGSDRLRGLETTRVERSPAGTLVLDYRVRGS